MLTNLGWEYASKLRKIIEDFCCVVPLSRLVNWYIYKHGKCISHGTNYIRHENFDLTYVTKLYPRCLQLKDYHLEHHEASQE